MLELLVNPKKAEKRPWQMFFVGFFYASLSVLAANFIFAKDPVLSRYLGIFIITFCVIFSMPFVYFTIRVEERKDREIEGETRLLKEHSKAIFTFLWLFVGFTVAFSVFYIAFPNGQEFFRAQIETFCQINRPDSFNDCLRQYGFEKTETISGSATARDRLISIFSNNIYVLIFTLLFSLVFGAGAIFILAWNASVIAAAVGIFTKSTLSNVPIGLLRYLIHGLPEIAAYFVAALAGGILSIAMIRRERGTDKMWSVILDALSLIIISIVILLISALIEVFITPKLF